MAAVGVNFGPLPVVSAPQVAAKLVGVGVVVEARRLDEGEPEGLVAVVCVPTGRHGEGHIQATRAKG